MLFRTELEDCKMQMRRLRGRVAGGSHISDHVAALHCHAFREAIGVVVQVGVVVAINSLAVELIDGDAAGFA